MKHKDEISKDTEVASGIHEATEIILEWVKTTQEIENNQWPST